MVANNFSRSFNRSTKAFEELVQPKALKILGGKFVGVEGNKSQDEVIGGGATPSIISMNHILDTKAGIDLWHVGDNGVRGVANRVQFGPTLWCTFTIRLSRDGQDPNNTEYAKRLSSIRNGYLYPTLTIQSYVNDQYELRAFAITYTSSILSMIERGLATEQHTNSAQYGQAAFYTVNWAAMGTEGYGIYTYRLAAGEDSVIEVNQLDGLGSLNTMFDAGARLIKKPDVLTKAGNLDIVRGQWLNSNMRQGGLITK